MGSVYISAINSYRSLKKGKLIKATLNGTIYMNELEIKSWNIMIVCDLVLNYILMNEWINETFIEVSLNFSTLQY